MASSNSHVPSQTDDIQGFTADFLHHDSTRPTFKFYLTAISAATTLAVRQKTTAIATGTAAVTGTATYLQGLDGGDMLRQLPCLQPRHVVRLQSCLLPLSANLFQLCQETWRITHPNNVLVSMFTTRLISSEKLRQRGSLMKL